MESKTILATVIGMIAVAPVPVLDDETGAPKVDANGEQIVRRNWQLRFNLELPINVRNSKGEWVLGSTKTMLYPESAIRALMYAADNRLTAYNELTIDAAKGYMLNSTVALTQTKYVAGDEYTATDGSKGKFEHDAYRYAIDKVEFNDAVNKKLDIAETVAFMRGLGVEPDAAMIMQLMK